MQIEILDRGQFASALVHLEPGEEFVSESGAMYLATDNIDIDVTTRAKRSGGMLGGLKRMLGGESFFLSTYKTTDSHPGHVGLAPVHIGDMKALALDGKTAWICTGGSYVGSSRSVEVDTQFQGVKGIFSGESLSFLKLSGTGAFLLSAYGHIVEHQVDGELTVDTGHVVAYEDTLGYTLGKLGGSWVQSFLGGEGVVFHFSGRGRLLVQSHNPKAFGKLLGALLPPRN